MKENPNITFELLSVGEEIKIKITSPLTSTYARWDISQVIDMNTKTRKPYDLFMVVQKYFEPNKDEEFPANLHQLYDIFLKFFNKDNLISKLFNIKTFNDLNSNNKALIEEFERRLKSFETCIFTTDEAELMFKLI